MMFIISNKIFNYIQFIVLGNIRINNISNINFHQSEANRTQKSKLGLFSPK